MPRHRERVTFAKFDVGDFARVREGALHPVYPDVPIAGWCGTIRKYDRLTKAYLMYWNNETMELAVPEYGRQCEEDGLDPGTTWIDESDLEISS